MCFFKRCRNKPPVVHESRHNIQITESSILIHTEFEVRDGSSISLFGKTYNYDINAPKFPKTEIILSDSVKERIERGIHIMSYSSSPCAKIKIS